MSQTTSLSASLSMFVSMSHIFSLLQAQDFCLEMLKEHSLPVSELVSDSIFVGVFANVR